MSQAYRFAPRTGHIFSGHRLNRAQTLNFKLDGTTYAGFAGDRLLSALLANGVCGAGMHAGHPIALTPSFAPHVAPAAEVSNPNYIVPMADVAIRDGDEFVTLHGRMETALSRTIRKVLGRGRQQLSLDFDDLATIPEPASPDEKVHQGHFDVVVIGAGVAGLNATLAAARAGSSVALVERRPYAGGDAELFGQVEGEDPPSELIAELTAELERHTNVRMFFTAEARTVSATAVEIVQVSETERGPKLRGLSLGSERVVLASGCESALGLFPGNRLPGIVSLSDAFHLASAYAVAPAHPAIIAGTTNAMYRFGMLARDAGLEVARILDARQDPRSRFREFAKAYGIPLVVGTQISGVTPLKGGLSLSTRLSWSEHGQLETGTFDAKSLISAAGWLPRLTLWHRRGGQLLWRDGAVSRAGEVPGFEVAGSAAGYLSLTACVQSGASAIASLFGRDPLSVEETTLSDMFESPDGAMPPVETAERGAAPAYLGGQTSLATHAGEAQHAFPHRRRGGTGNRAGDRWLSQDDIRTLVQLGAIGSKQAAGILSERALNPSKLMAEPVRKFRQTPTSTQLPAYLAGRFGEDQTRCEITADEARQFEPGMLIFENSDETVPEKAVGVIIQADDTCQVALLAASHAVPGERLVLRTGTTSFPVWVSGIARAG